jgi:hypothetical protein
LRTFPDLVIDNAKMRSGDHPAILPSDWDARCVCCVRVLHHPDFVPDDAADIELVEDQAPAPLRIALDCRTTPSRPAWRSDAPPIEISGDFTRRPTTGISSKNPSNDLDLRVRPRTS